MDRADEGPPAPRAAAAPGGPGPPGHPAAQPERRGRPPTRLDRSASYWTGPGRGWLAELDLPAASREIVTDCLAVIDGLAPVIDRIDAELHAYAKADPRVKVLRTLPGVREFTALVMVAEIGNITRFPRARKLASWAGLTPTVRGSDLKVRHGNISKMVCAGGTVPLRRPGMCDGGRRRTGFPPGQLAFDYVDTGTGESWRGRISPADRESLRGWLRRFNGVPDMEFRSRGAPGSGTSGGAAAGQDHSGTWPSPPRRRACGAAGAAPQTDQLADHLGIFSLSTAMVEMGVATVAGHDGRRGWGMQASGSRS